MQIENIQGMLLQSLGAHLCAPGCLCLCSSALKSCGKGISASPHVVSVTSGFSMWFHVETHPLGFCGSALKWKIQMVLAHGIGDAESMGGSVQCVTVFLCQGTCHPACLWKPPQFCKAWSVCIPGKEMTWSLVHSAVALSLDFFAQVKVDPRLTHPRSQANSG